VSSVSIESVRKAYGKVEILHDVSISVPDGAFTVLVGPSGCGKSTLLRMLAGLEHITGGQIKIGDRVVNDLPPKQRDIAMVFQNYALYPHMTVAQNMGFSLDINGVSKQEIQKKVEQAAATLGLTKLLERYPKQLSGGQRQRVAMGRAIVRNPAVFLFDEPLSNLDAKLRVEVRTEIKALHQRLGTTAVYVTHDQIEAMTMADQIVVMNGGYVEQTGSPLDLYDRPANRFVAGFIGSPSMNFLEGTVGDGGFRLPDGTILPLPDTGLSVGTGQDAIYGIRPEHLSLDGQGPTSALTVQVVEPTGSETQVFGSIGSQDITGVFRERVGNNAVGQKLQVYIDPQRVHLFRKDNGKRL
jgi:multiple sugar transport system ATP-binding protein